MLRRAPRSTRFPYTTLFRSVEGAEHEFAVGIGTAAVDGVAASARHGRLVAVCLLNVVPNLLRVVRVRSEEHTSELQSQSNLVCRLLLEKKNNRATRHRRAHP